MTEDAQPAESGTENTAPATEPEAAAKPAEEPAAELPPDVAKIAEGYSFEGAAIDLGVVVEQDQALPEAVVRLPLGMMNRHGLVAGATGTGKTKTLQLLAEQLSSSGVPVFAADIKGDLSGIGAPGEGGEKLLARTKAIGQDWQPLACPTEFYAL